MIINQSTMQGIFTSFSTIFNKAFTETPSMWNKVAMQVPSESAVEDYRWLGDFPGMKEWVGDRVIKDLSTFKYAVTNKNFESTIEVDRNDIEDDKIGVFKPMIQEMARVAKEHPDVLIFDLLKNGDQTPCYDGQYFFDTDHPVGEQSVSNIGGGAGTAWYLMDLSRAFKPLILQMRKKPEFVALDAPKDENVFMRRKIRYGVDDRKNAGYGLWQLAYASKQTLDPTNYKAALTAMMSFKNDEGVPLGIVPTHLVAPPALMEEGQKLVKVPNDAAGAGNPWYNTAELLVVPWLA